MDQAPAALSNILGGALDEIREEFNELKQSNAALLKKVEALESANTKNVVAIRHLLQALAQHKGVAQAQKVNLATVRNETAAVKLLLMARGKGVETPEESVAEEAAAPETHEEEVVEPTEQQNEILTPAPRPVPSVSPKRPPFVRDMSVESSMTFCTAEQSVQRQKRRAVGLFDKPILPPPGLQVSTPEPAEDGKGEESPPKKRKTVSSEAANTAEDGSLKETFAVPALPHRLAAADTIEPTILAASTQSSKVATEKSAPAHNNDDVEMEDTIMVVPKHQRTPRALSNVVLPPLTTSSLTPTCAQGTIDSVLQDFDVATSAAPSQISLPPTSGHPAGIPADAKDPAAVNADEANTENEPEVHDPDLVDLDSGLAHDPENRGENDQTGELEEYRYSTISLNSKSYTIDRSRAHADQVQEWKSWAVSTKGKWYQWKRYSALDWTNASEVEKMNKWRHQALKRAGFMPPRSNRPRWDYAPEERDWVFQYVKAAEGGELATSIEELTRQFNLQFGDTRDVIGIQSLVNRLRKEYAIYDGEQKPSGRTKNGALIGAELASEDEVDDVPAGNTSKATVSQPQGPKSITRSALLSQFKARTGEMQKGKGSQSPTEQTD